MNRSSPSRKSALKNKNHKTLRREVGDRRIVNANGRARKPRQTPLMFSNTINVRPFNFRNEAAQAANANGNVIAPLIDTYNARGKAPIIPRGDPRTNPAFAEEAPANIERLTHSLQTARHNRALGRLQNESTRRLMTYPGLDRSGPRKLMAKAATFKEGRSVPYFNRLIAEGATPNYITAELEAHEEPYRHITAYNEKVAREAAKYNEKVARAIEAEGPHARRNTRRNSRK